MISRSKIAEYCEEHIKCPRALSCKKQVTQFVLCILMTLIELHVCTQCKGETCTYLPIEKFSCALGYIAQIRQAELEQE